MYSLRGPLHAYDLQHTQRPRGGGGGGIVDPVTDRLKLGMHGANSLGASGSCSVMSACTHTGSS